MARPQRLRVAALGWPVALWAALLALFGRFGFNIGDEGFVLAQSWRILHGEVPHVDFVTPRPAGSAYLHVVDLLVPGPLLLASRGIALAEIVLATVLLCALVVGKRVSDLSVLQALGAAVAVLLSLHTFPVLAWHTIDGLAFSAAGIYVVVAARRTGRTRVLFAGALLVGAAAVMKQSFAPVAVAVALWLVLSRDLRVDRGRLVGLAGLVLPGLVYVLVVAGAGGLSEMIDQLTQARTAFGGGLWPSGPSANDRGSVVWAALAVTALALVAMRAPRWALRAAAAVAVAAVVVVVVWQGRFDASSWGTALFWGAAGVTICSSAIRRSPDLGGVLVCGMGWMVSLSWGYAFPLLAAGPLAFYVIARTWERVDPPPIRRLAPAAVALAGIAALVVTVRFVDYRRADVFFDHPASEHSFRLGAWSSRTAGIRTSQVTGDYLIALKRCVKSHPAPRTVVMPDTAVAYPMLRLHNPLPADWLLRDEYAGSRGRVLRALREVRQRPGHLILLQLLAADELPTRTGLPDAATMADADRAAAMRRTFQGRDDILPLLLAELPGKPFACGPFLGWWKPERPA